MRIGAFQLCDPVPECNEPYVVAVLRPWIDVNSVGTLVLKELASRFQATEMATLARPGFFYDFTRYRPIIDLAEGIRGMNIPNTTIRHARREGQNDLLLLRLLEPHAHAEFYISSMMKFFKAFKVKKYILLGSMYDTVPHTRPLIVSGYGMGGEAIRDVRKAHALPITYRGPSSILNLIASQAAESGIEAAVFIVSLPQYVVLEQDYSGKARLMEVLNLLYQIPIDERDYQRASEQRRILVDRVAEMPQLNVILPQLESIYDERIRAMGPQEASNLTPEMEEMIWKITGDDVGKA